MKNNITILLSSCDLYEDAWYPFLRLWQIQWPDCPYKIVLSTETKKCHCDYLNIKTVNSGKGVSWSKRLRDAIDEIDTEFILFSLEDFFLTEKVNIDLFNQAKNLMEDNSRIGLINFFWERLGTEYEYKEGEDSYFKPMDKKNTARTNVVISLWRKEYFKKMLYKDEDPWQYEKNAPLRALYAGYDIYSQRYAVSSPVFHYCMNPADGLGITQRKWLKDNKILFEKYGINDVNFDNLGFFEERVTYKEIKEKKKKEQIESLNGVNKYKEIAYNFIRDFKKKKKIMCRWKLRQHIKIWWYYKQYDKKL